MVFVFLAIKFKKSRHVFFIIAVMVVKSFKKFNNFFLTAVISTEEEWLPIYAPYMCHFSKPLEDIPPVYDEDEGVVKCYMTCTYGTFIRCYFKRGVIQSLNKRFYGFVLEFG